MPLTASAMAWSILIKNRFHMECKIMSLITQFAPSPFGFFLLRINASLSTVLNSINLNSSLTARDRVSHPYNAGKIIVFIFKSLANGIKTISFYGSKNSPNLVCSSRVQTGYGAHPVSNTVGKKGPFPGKADGA
jgi:hypothetical protein